jgi:hypothetical protein
LEIGIAFRIAVIAAWGKNGGRFVLVATGVTVPKITHAPLIDIPRNPSGYEHRTAVGAMVKSVSSHASSTHTRIRRFYKLLSNRGGSITNNVHTKGKTLMSLATTPSAAGGVNNLLSETVKALRPPHSILLQCCRSRR